MNLALAWKTPARWDPRYYQIAVLGSLLAYGVGALDFEVRASQAAAILATALATQWACSRLARRAFDPRSALISGLSLCLLLRTGDLRMAVAGAILAIAPKFILRWRGKHLFNPTNFAIVALLICGRGWVSPGPWGNAAFFGFLVACLGGVVVTRAARADVAGAFLAFWAAILFGRSLRLGEPMTIPLHRLENGALLIFAFFMISDPKTTPDSRAGRVLFAALVAGGAWFVQFKLFRANGLLWSLAAWSLAAPLIDWLLPGSRYEWNQPAAPSRPGPPQPTKGSLHEPQIDLRGGHPALRPLG